MTNRSTATPSKEQSQKSKPYYPLGLVLAVGRGFWRILRAGQRLLRQPRLEWEHLILKSGSQTEIELHALKIAVTNVKYCIEPRLLLNGEEKLVLCAGVRNFREPWARDFGFATYGLMALGQDQVVREGLEAFLYYQEASGQFPVKLHSTNVVERYMHSLFKREQPIIKPLRPKYQTAHRTISLDGNSLLVIAALHYVSQTDDLAFLKTHWDGLCRAITWLEEHAIGEDGLLHQGAFTDWADSIGRTGRILYTNVLYWKAISGLAEASVHCEDEARQQWWRAKAQRLNENIHDHFWQESLGYFVTSERYHNLSSSGNTLAVAWGLATKEQSQAILDAMERLGMADPVPTQVVSHGYRRRDVAVENRIALIPHYHTNAAWLWLGSWHAIALARAGRPSEAEELIDRMSKAIVQDGVVHEVYGKNGRFLSTFLYTSEAPLTWNASMVIYAFSICKREIFSFKNRVS
jgi:GH15 family glucan-1,4-alpha-glucosidase